MRRRSGPEPGLPARARARALVASAAVACAAVAGSTAAGATTTAGVTSHGSTARQASSGSSACAADGTQHVAVVIDFGDVASIAGSPGGVGVVCLPLARHESSTAALFAASAQLGWPAVRSDGGFICAIDGYPRTGCAVRQGARYIYWSYWKGSPSGWNFSNVGSDGSRAACGTVEGWRFIDSASAAAADATPPRAPSDASQIYGASLGAMCPSASTPTSAGGVTAPTGGAGSSDPPPSSLAAPLPIAPGPGSPTTALGSGSSPSASTPTPRHPADGSKGAGRPTSTSTDAATGDGTTHTTTGRALLAASRQPRSTVGGHAQRSSLAGLAVGIAAIACLVIAGGVQARRRRA